MKTPKKPRALTSRKYSQDQIKAVLSAVFKGKLSAAAAGQLHSVPAHTAQYWVRRHRVLNGISPHHDELLKKKKIVFRLVFEHGMSAPMAGRSVNLDPRVASRWVQAYKRKLREAAFERKSPGEHEAIRRTVINLVNKYNVSPSTAARKMGVTTQTAQRWVRDYKNDLAKVEEAKNGQKKRDRVSLNGKHSEFLAAFYTKNPGATPREAVQHLCRSFGDLKLSS